LVKPLGKFPVYVSAIAAILVLVSCIVIGAALHEMAFWVSLTIVMFFLIGHLFRLYVVDVFFPPELEFEEEEEGLTMEEMYEMGQDDNAAGYAEEAYEEESYGEESYGEESYGNEPEEAYGQEGGHSADVAEMPEGDDDYEDEGFDEDESEAVENAFLDS